MYSIEINQVTKRYKTKRGLLTAVKDVTLQIEKSKITALLGPNGSGKTTLIKMICGLASIDQGTIFVNDIDVKKKRKKAVHQIGCMLEGERNIYYYLTVFDNLKYFGLLNLIPKQTLHHRIEQILKLLGLEEKKKEYAANLSRGMQQKLALALVLLKDPDILLLDEPTLGLDVQSSNDILTMLRKMALNGKTILLTSHQLDLVEKISDRMIFIKNGTIIEDLQSKEKEQDNQQYVYLDLNIPNQQVLQELEHLIYMERENERIWKTTLAHLPEILQYLKDQQVTVKNLTTQRKSLEQIFLELVGDSND
ncbi:ABC transporter ATP-binding protein [Fervidibacillus halotolerans]|uniref:ABC transporter ATP-binding protein n=1 Tax=Fervidibacillus halotolerans TaxID=2980027 RepID=A0A9E8RWH0_9BACI|nr:ABC transporter ATP-binding protein [Fervidibacillus halotolerans]WAA11745.1 ABC transporter ATP-binding protein [Fervidibacillus halotolerans]